MKTAILQVTAEGYSDEFRVDTDKISYELAKAGHTVSCSVSLGEKSKISETFKALLHAYEVVVVCGDTTSFYAEMHNEYEIDTSASVFAWEDAVCAVSSACDDEFLRGTLLPALRSLRRTAYATQVFRTFGKTADELKTLLREPMKNRNKIVFSFTGKPPLCDVLVRYSQKTQKDKVDAVLHETDKILAPYVYAYEDTEDLPSVVAKLLMRHGKTLGVAESFTGGTIAASLVQTAGISASFKEGIVCYANEVKQNRLRVSEQVLRNYGAVSDETAYEMTVNLLVDGKYDYAVATTGNAGPTAEKEGEVGICYIAVGDRNAVDVYREYFDGDRAEVIRKGALTALYRLYERLVHIPAAQTTVTAAP